MDQSTVYTKTAKGITQVNQRSASLSKDLMKVLKLIDGKSNFGQIMEKAELDKNQLEKALNSLAKDGYARVFQTKKEEADPFGDDDFDFTAPGKMAPVATQRVIPGAANDISELVRQQQKADADRKSKEQAHDAARTKAKAEAEARARAEAEAKARQQAEQQAMEQARKAKEASERARLELETKKREEEARNKAIAEQQARLTAEQKAKQEAESRRLMELREKAEREAKALAEARARAEAEAEAMAKARAAAEEAVKRKAAEASNAEAQMKARLKEEIEARIRGEMEELLRTEVEEDKDKTREEMRAQILAEARLAAKAELEERLREERETIARAEMEARAKAEKEAQARAESESKKRAEAEARAVAESQARMKAEEEANRLRAQVEEQARRAKGEAEARARLEAESREKLEAERRERYEAEARAKIEAEEREKRERELSATIEAERRAKEEAEMRARIEAKARETIAEDTRAKVQAELESDLEKKAEIEGKAQAKAYMHAKAKAEQDEEEKMRKDQERRAREIADVLRTKVEADEQRPEGAPERRRPPLRIGQVVRPVIIGVVVLLAIAIGVLHVVPMPTAKFERTLAAWLQDDVSIESLVFRAVPSPHLRFTNLSVGKSFDAKAETGKLMVDLGSLFGDRPGINAVELERVTIGSEAVKRIPAWGASSGKPQGGGITRISMKAVKIDVRPEVAGFDATLEFTPKGAVTKVALNSAAGWSVVAVPIEGGFDLDINARNFTLPTAVQIPVDARLKGTLRDNVIDIPQLEGSLLEGQLNGSLKVTWGKGVRLDSALALQKINAQKLVNAFTKDIAVVGRMDGNFNIVAEGTSAETLFNTTRAQGKFRVGEGSISNVDLVAVMQSDSAGTRAGVTKFNELSGELSTVEKRANFRQVNLQGGVLRGNGAFEIGPNASLSGRLGLEMRSQVAQDRGSFAVSGTVSRPVIRRGG
jgi:hypothetical protein